MPIRNPFAKRPGTALVSDENARPDSSAGDNQQLGAPGFERADTMGSKASSALSIRSQDNGEYKMSGKRLVTCTACTLLQADGDMNSGQR
jgi:hypothetical protein